LSRDSTVRESIIQTHDLHAFEEELMAETPENLPSGAGEIARTYPEIWAAYAALGKACSEAGPLDGRTRRMVKLALAVGALSEGAVHSHTRRGLADGLTKEELKQVALLAIPTLGFPQGVKALTWIEDITDPASFDAAPLTLSESPT
jgi:alkylhydroperoxidase/carboxymuconolactone decarboxylase family protein YurZ